MKLNAVVTALAALVCGHVTLALPSQYGGACGTLTTTVALTETTTVYATLTSNPAVLPDQAEIYSFAMNNGTTSWINGASPTFTSYHIETTIITVYQTASVVPADASGSGIESAVFESISSSSSALLPTITSTSLALSTVTVSLDDTTTQTSSTVTESNSLESTRTSHVVSTVTNPAVTIIESLSYVSVSGSTSTLTLHITSTIRVSKTLTATSTTQLQTSSSTSPLDISAVSVSSQSSSYAVSSGVPPTSSSVVVTTSTSWSDSYMIGTTESSSVSSTTETMSGWVPLSGYSGAASSLPTTSSFRLSFYNSTTPIHSSASTADAVHTSAYLSVPGNFSSAVIPSTSSARTTSSLEILPQYQPISYGRPFHSSLSGSVSQANISFSVASFDNATATSMPSVLPAAVSNKPSTSLSAYGQLSPTGTSTSTPMFTPIATSTPPHHTSFSRAAAGYFNVTATKTSFAAAASSSASQCGVQGDVLLTWDDEPAYNTNSTDITTAPPIFGPYHRFYFSQGYVYAPKPNEPYVPVSQPHLAVFITHGTGASNSVAPGYIRPGEIEANNIAMRAFWFNAYSAFLGCDNAGPQDCRMELSGYTYLGFSDDEVLTYQQNVTIPACPSQQGCQLQRVEFPAVMRGLSGLQIRAFVGDEQRIWFMDNLALGWYDTSCKAGIQRAEVHG